MSYKADFARADEAFRQELLPVTDVQRMKLYGLSKQAKEGDCTLPMPPR